MTLARADLDVAAFDMDCMDFLSTQEAVDRMAL
jgi:hypothetical protein